VENGQEKAQYDISKGTIQVLLPKEQPGQEFEDLDLLGRLLARKQDPNLPPGPSIQVIGGDDNPNPLEELKAMVDDEEEDFNWEMEQELPREPLVSSARYGFNLQYSAFFDTVQDEVLAVIEIPDLEGSTPASRRELRLQFENDKFDDDHYM